MNLFKKEIAILCCVALMSIVLSSCFSKEGIKEKSTIQGIAAGTTQNNIQVTTYTPIATEGDLTLSLNYNTGSLRLENKRTGEVSNSNPKGATTDLERSQFVLTYLNKKGIWSTMNSYSDCIKTGQYRVESIKNGVKISLTCGEYLEELLLPYVISVENFEALLKNISGDFEKLYVTSRYKLTDIKKVQNQTERETLLKRYPILKNKQMYLLKQDIPNVSIKRELHRIFKIAGYTKENYDRDLKQIVGTIESNLPYFTFSVYYTLVNGNLKVRIPGNEIAEVNDGQLLKITLLPYMDTPDIKTTGHYLLPDGSGSLMNFRNQKKSLFGYESTVYGVDITNQPSEKRVNILPSYLPVIGSIRQDHTMLTYVTEGAAIATVRAESGNETNFPYAYFEFSVRPDVLTKLNSDGAADGFITTAKKKYMDDIVVEYTLYPSGTDYSELAGVMRNKLFGNDKQVRESSPLACNFLGTAKENQSFMGLKYQKNITFSSLKQVADICDEIFDTIPNTTIRLSGFINDGLNQKVNKNFYLEGGNREQLALLFSSGQLCYLSSDFLMASSNSLWDSFNVDQDSAYTLENLVAKYKRYNPATFQTEPKRFQFVLNSAKNKAILENIINSFKGMQVTGIGLNDGGSLLGADYNRTHGINRQQMMIGLVEQMKKAKVDYALLADGANSYVLPYVTTITNMYLTSSEFDVCDESVPFIPMVLCGNVDYFGHSMNTINNDISSFLRSIETGAGLYYTLTANEEANFAKTDFDEYFSTKYSTWKPQIMDKAVEIQKLFSQRGRYIIKHEKVANQIYKTTYENGFYTVVNYGANAYKYNDMQVDAMGYIYGGE